MAFLDRLGLQAQFMLLSLGGLIVLFGFSAFIGLNAVQRSTELLFQERIAVARTVAADIDNAMVYSIEEIEKMASLAPPPREGGHGASATLSSQDATGCLSMCHDRAKVGVSRVGIADISGTLLGLEPHSFGDPAIGDQSEAVRQAVVRGKTYIAEAAGRNAAEAARVVIATPVKDEGGAVRGALVLEVDPFSRSFATNPSPDLSSAGYAVEILNERGSVVTGFGQRSRTGEISQHISVVGPLLKESKAGASIQTVSGTWETSEHDQVVAFAPLRTVPWGVVVDQSPETALAPLQALQRNILLIGGLGLIGTLSIVWLTTRRIIKPIRSLTVATQKIAGGDLGQPLEMAGEDEIGLLARSFEEMRHKLQASQREIESWNKALEQRVQRRTKELSILVETSQVFASTLELDTLLDATMAKIQEIFPQADAGALFLYDNVADVLVLKTSFGFALEPSHALTLRPGEDSVGRAFVARTTYTNDEEPLSATLIESLSAENRAYLGEEGERKAGSCVCVPLIHEQGPIGTLAVYSLRQPGGFPPPDVRLLGALANQATIAIENAKLYKETSEMAALRELDRLKTEFVARASHELRTPLTSIKSLAETLMRTDIALRPAQRREFLGAINMAADRLARIITDLLTVSRIESGDMELRMEPTPLRPLVERVIRQVQAQDPNRTISTRIPPDFPAVVADPNRLEDVLSNLLSNALKYSLSGTEVRVEARFQAGELADTASASSGQQVIVSVIDEGVGISTEGMSGLFQRFGRVDGAARRGIAGVGLGLYICKAYVEAMGGSIWAQSTSG